MRSFEKKELKNLDTINKLIRNAYNNGYIVGNADYDEVFDVANTKLAPGMEKSLEVFDHSYFRNVIKYFPIEMQVAIVFPIALNDAIKDRVTTIKLEDNNIIFTGGKEKGDTIVGKQINLESILKHHEKEKQFMPKPEAIILKRIVTEEELTRLIDYEPVTIRYNTKDVKCDIALVATCKLFPNIKKVKASQVKWFIEDESSEHYMVELSSTYMDKVTFIALLKAIRC